MEFTETDRDFPKSAGILFGLGLGGFFDGIVLHQLLQWHHMLTSFGYPADNVRNLEINRLWGRYFSLQHVYFCPARSHYPMEKSAPNAWSGKLLAGTMLIGFGIFNLVEGIVDHQLLGIHHVNETVPQSQWIYWDLGFLIWGALMLAGGWFLLKGGEQETPERAIHRQVKLNR